MKEPKYRCLSDGCFEQNAPKSTSVWATDVLSQDSMGISSLANPCGLALVGCLRKSPLAGYIIDLAARPRVGFPRATTGCAGPRIILHGFPLWHTYLKGSTLKATNNLLSVILLHRLHLEGSTQVWTQVFESTFPGVQWARNKLSLHMYGHGVCK